MSRSNSFGKIHSQWKDISSGILQTFFELAINWRGICTTRNHFLIVPGPHTRASCASNEPLARENRPPQPTKMTIPTHLPGDVSQAHNKVKRTEPAFVCRRGVVCREGVWQALRNIPILRWMIWPKNRVNSWEELRYALQVFLVDNVAQREVQKMALISRETLFK